MLEVEIGGHPLLVPDGIYRKEDGWLVRAANGRPDRRFSDGKEGPLHAFTHAVAWLNGRAARAPYDMDLTRVPHRRLTLTRRFRSGGPEASAIPRFDLEISPSRSSERRPWMRIFLGTAQTLNQARINSAIATLHARWDAYREQLSQHSREHVLLNAALAAEIASIVVPEALPQRMRPYPTRLLAKNVRAWNGIAVGVGFSPSRTVDPARTEIFIPEQALLAKESRRRHLSKYAQHQHAQGGAS